MIPKLERVRVNSSSVERHRTGKSQVRTEENINNDRKLTVYVLMGESHLNFSIDCLKSLQSFSEISIKFTICSDGSICDKQQILEQNGLYANVLKYETMQDLVCEKIQAYPRTLKLYKNYIFTKKILDPLFLSQRDRINYSDSDILALRSFSGVFDNTFGNYFMDNLVNSLSISWKYPSLLRRVPLARNVNCGLFSIHKKLVDLDYIEWLLGLDGFESGSKFHVEQTVWAALLARQIKNSKLYDRSSVIIPKDEKFVNNSERTLIHFTQPKRWIFYSRRIDKSLHLDRISVGSTDAEILTPVSFLADRLEHKLSRLVRW
jgi:lipopolysaccharide biosynthesis glycosyltransferase